MRKRLLLLILILTICSTALALPVYRLAPLTIQIKSSTTTVAGTAVKVPGTALAGRESVALYNVTNATETVWCGGSDVSSANGFPLTSSAPAITIDLDDSVDVYCISDGTSTDVRSLEVK